MHSELESICGGLLPHHQHHLQLRGLLLHLHCFSTPGPLIPASSRSTRECLPACWPLAISVLLSCAYHLPTPPQSCCGVPTTNPCLLWFCQRVPVSLLAPCHLSPAELCLPPTHATSVLLWCAYHQPMPTLVLPESACQLAGPLPSQSC